MSMTLSDLQQRVTATRPAPDADLLTRLHAAQQMMADLQSILRALIRITAPLRPYVTFSTQFQSTIWFATGVILGLDPEATEAEREEAVERVAHWLERGWYVHDDRVRDEIDRRAKAQGTSWRAVKLEALRSAVWLAFRDDLNRPQTLCFRPEGWLVDAAGHKLVTVPGDLPLPLSHRWAYTRTKKWAAAWVLDMTPDAYERSRAQSDHSRVPITVPLVGGGDMDRVDVDRDADPAYLLLEREEALEQDAEDAAFWEIITPAQRRLCLARLALGEKGSWTSAAHAIGMAEDTAHVHVSRMRAKLRQQGYVG